MIKTRKKTINLKKNSWKIILTLIKLLSKYISRITHKLYNNKIEREYTVPQNIKRSEAWLGHLWQRGCAFLECRYAIMGGAMTWVSEHKLVAAISNAGGFGVLASGSMPPEMLSNEIKATRQMTKNSFGINLITLHPRLEEMVQVCIDHAASHVVLAGGLPPSWAIQKIKHHNIKLICFAPTLGLARKLIRSGVDALVIEGAEAGGHIGPVATAVLAQEILPVVRDVPVFVAGGIGRGEMIVAYLEMGASGVQLGTKFVCAHESVAHPRMKQAFRQAQAREALPSVQIDQRFPIIPVRALTNQSTQRFIQFQRETVMRFEKGELDQKQAQLAIEHFWAGALRRAVVDGDIESGSLMAGQSVGMVDDEKPVQQILHELVTQATSMIANRFQTMQTIL
jgi:enoyl-[acyl-carrier protein] reductase II